MALEKERYIKVRRAQAQGARTIEELKTLSDIIIENDEELKEIESLLQVACKCNNVSIKQVIDLVNNGADTIEKINETVNTFDYCRKCERIIQNIIENKR